MSQFKTTIPVDTKAVIDALPKNSFLHEVRFNAAASVCEVLWENDDIKSGYNFAVDMPVGNFPKAYEQQRAGFSARMAQIAVETAANVEAFPNALANAVTEMQSSDPDVAAPAPEKQPKKSKKTLP